MAGQAHCIFYYPDALGILILEFQKDAYFLEYSSQEIRRAIMESYEAYPWYFQATGIFVPDGAIPSGDQVVAIQKRALMDEKQ